MLLHIFMNKQTNGIEIISHVKPKHKYFSVNVLHVDMTT